MEEKILEIFKKYGQWLEENGVEDNINNYIYFINEIEKIHIFKVNYNIERSEGENNEKV